MARILRLLRSLMRRVSLSFIILRNIVTSTFFINFLLFLTDSTDAHRIGQIRENLGQ